MGENLDAQRLWVVTASGLAVNASSAFRRMWRLPDSKAEGKPPFVALMYHGRDTRAYEVPAADLDEYVAERVEHIKRGDPSPRDVRLTSGEVLRLQCAVLPNGGRMLSYTPVTDIVRHADEMEVLKAALNNVQDGVVLLDADLNARFQNRAVRHLFKVPDHQAETPTPFSLLIGNARKNGMFGVPGDKLAAFIASRISLIRAGDGRRIRARCTAVQPFIVDGEPVVLAVSIGLAAATLSMSGIDALMKAADQALYSAKSQGRNRVVQFAPIGTPKLAAE